MKFQDTVKHIMKDCFLAGYWEARRMNGNEILPAELFEIWFSGNKDTEYWIPYPDVMPPINKSIYAMEPDGTIVSGIFTAKGRIINFDGDEIKKIVKWLPIPF